MNEYGFNKAVAKKLLQMDGKMVMLMVIQKLRLKHILQQNSQKRLLRPHKANKNMYVQELIDRLNLVTDKSLPVSFP